VKRGDGFGRLLARTIVFNQGLSDSRDGDWRGFGARLRRHRVVGWLSV